MNVWKKLQARWAKLKDDKRQELERMDAANRVARTKVKTRQVLRRIMFEESLKVVNAEVGGERRANRRRIARARARRNWRIAA